ncbi:MAG: glutamate--cysteine ligase [SAR324 cluster bacterium]|nr:glutamate--cysteine ligase [SAR324 cluster bacterium]
MTHSKLGDAAPSIGAIDELIASFRQGEKPREQWRIGTEHEKIGFYREAREPIPYEGERGIRAILETFAERFGWQPQLEDGYPIALLRGEASITLEPGGQVELSGATLGSAHEACTELIQHLREIEQISEPLGIVWLTLGRNPFIAREAMPWVPKQRYKIMRRYLPSRGSMALDMMVGTGTVQTNFDYSDEADMSRKMRVATAAAPILNALFANSPFAAGRPSGYLSSRAHIWLNTDPDRCGIVPAALEEGFGYREYAEYALDVPMFFIHRDGRYIDHAGRSFRQFLSEGLDGETANLEDWELHLTTLFPEVRLKSWLELRMCDAGAREMICALAALTRGLFYDPTALDDALHLVREIKGHLFPAALENAARWGLDATLLDRPLSDWARDLVTIAADGLKRLNVVNSQGRDERIYLCPLDNILDTGKSHAALLMELWNGAWGQNLDPLFTQSYFY